MLLSMKKWVPFVLAALLMVSLLPAVKAEGASASASSTNYYNLAPQSTYTWSEAPESAYPDPGNKLTDGVIGSTFVLDPAWVGHIRKQAREIEFDLGASKSIASIKVHFLQDWPSSAILFPLTVSMYVSDDKEHWALLSHKATEKLWVDGPPVDQYYTWDGSEDGIAASSTGAEIAYARYVKVVFTMHTRAWSFIDEVEIMGADGKLAGAQTIPPSPYDYQVTGADTAGINNLTLLYNGHYSNGDGDWTKETIMPHISYVDNQGEPLDWMFDGVLYLGLFSPNGKSFDGSATVQEWNWYLNKTFAAQGDMHQLNEAAKEVGQKLGDPNHKVKVVVMIPDPGEYLTDFGDVDGDGQSENFNAGQVGMEQAMINRKKGVSWWIDQVEARWAQATYSNLELSGLYWLSEQVSTSSIGPEMLESVSGMVHAKNMKLFWIPHFLAYKSYMWQDVGIDAAAFQPNYFFEEMSGDRIEDAAKTAKRYNMGVEIEFDSRLLTEPDIFRQRYIEYLDGGVKYGYMGSPFKAYYQGSGPVLRTAALSQDPDTRILYDWLYQFVKGTYVLNSGSSAALKQSVERFEAAGEFKNHGAARSLTAKLDSVIRSEQKQQTNQAVEHMNDFVEHLHSKQKSGHISGKAYQQLFNTAQCWLSNHQ
ncbi:DUF4855 domain-containing protein [Paenibacillus aquistagni]|uniref:F5/8 type C domain-containing protein n=1 Tax=Paenibacillus aquistagni TaxID=1852522 RepID=A0A1X7KN50_9BACL|nr:DUF4855 domain-containing protein [Paenibacillus aquistagni]SMG42592.1 protein of unknown function [Paenibacillus aquistagni]